MPSTFEFGVINSIVKSPKYSGRLVSNELLLVLLVKLSSVLSFAFKISTLKLPGLSLS